jgi:hypothetical protein
VLVALVTVVGGLIPAAPAFATTAAASTPPAPKLVPQPKQHPIPPGLPVLQNGFGPSSQQQASMKQALTTAHGSGKSAVVDGFTTETQQVVAQPKGGFSLTTSAEPVRTQQGGQWVPVDTTLHRNANGSYSPVATAYGSVTFSSGGRGPLATTVSGGTSYAVSWPGVVPAPAVSGSTATYANILPGVDVVLSATDTGGFSDVLVVHNAVAAANPALANLTLPTAVTGGQVRSGSNGVIEVVGAASSARRLVGSTPMMWDSNIKPASPAPKPGQKAVPTLAPSAVDPSDVTHPGMAAHVAVVADHAAASGLSLIPDHHLLTDPSTVFPLYVDPTFNWDNSAGNNLGFDEVKQGSPCTNTSFYDNATPDSGNFGMLGVGYNNWSSCIGIERAYLQWQLPSVIWGAHIGNVAGQPGAVVDVDKTYSAACINSGDYLHTAGAIGPGTSWNNQPYLGPVIAQATVGPTQNCPGGFGDVKVGFDVTGAIAQAAADHSSLFTVGITGNEARGNDEFSRFNAVAQQGLSAPSLQIFFNLPPNTPGPTWAAAGSDNVGCATIAPYPYMGKTILTNTPVLNATVSDPDPGNSLQATFHYSVMGQSTIYAGTSADNLPSGATAQYSLPASFVSGLKDGDVVLWQAQATDGEDVGSWSQACYFTAEPSAPSAPTITSADGLYPNNGTVGATATTTGRFTVAATGGNVTSLVDHLDQAPPFKSPPIADYDPMDGGSTIAPAGHWKLSDNTGTTATDSSGNNHPATLHGGAAWTTDPNRGPVLAFDGSTGYTSTAGPVLNTEGSFSVSAWVNIKAFTSGVWSTLVVQQASTASGLYLEHDPTTGDWSFSRNETDTVNPAVDRAESTNPAQTGVWTHLVGVYDSTNGAMTLYVNGAVAGTAIDQHSIAANGPVDIGHGYFNGAPNNWVDGSISDVQLYQYPLSATDVDEIYQGKTASAAARWTFSEGNGTTAADSSGNNHTATLSGGYVWNTGSPSAMYFNGTNGSAATSGPILDTTGSFTVSAWVQIETVTAGQWQTFLVQEAGTSSGFYLERDPTTGDWSFSRTEADINNPPADRAESSSPTNLYWTHLVGTYDADSGAMTLYVNGAQSGTATDRSPIASSGPVEIGHGFFNGVANNYANASIADVQLYSTALNSSEVGELYASATSFVTPQSPGPHTLYGYAADAAGDASGYQAYSFIAGKDPNTSCSSLSACYDNTGISPDNNPSLANFDGEGNSFSATDLTNAGWTSGGKITVDGGTFTLPQYGNGKADNLLSANQTILNSDPTLSTYNATVPASASSQVGTSSLEFLTTATYAYTATPGAIDQDDTAPYVPEGTPVAGRYCFDLTNPAAYCPATGEINYVNDPNPQPFVLTVPDWVVGPYGIDTMWMPHENWSGGAQNTTNFPKMYAFSVPLHRGEQIASVTLPDVGNVAGLTTAALHIFSMATRNTTTTSATSQASSQTWTGAWASANEADFGGNATNGGFANETFRETVQPSLSGNTIRIKLDDALGNAPLQIGNATIAVQSAVGSPIPSATPVPLTFSSGQACPGGAPPCVEIPQGGMLYSDPLNFSVTAGQRLLVSVQLVNTVPSVPMHTWPTNSSGQWLSPSGSGDQTMDMTGTPYTGHGWGELNSSALVTGLDVQTSAIPTLAVLGNGLIDQGQTGTQPIAGITLSDDLIATEATTPNPYGTLAEGIEANQVMSSFPEANNSGGPSALARIDRDILDQPGINTVFIDEGLEDLLANQPGPDKETAEENLARNGYAELVNYLQASHINIVYVGLTPCDGYAGDGATANDPCTSTVDSERQDANTDLSGRFGSFVNSDAAVGVPDASNGETKLMGAADGGDHVNLTDAGFGALANAYLGSQNEWTLADGSIANPVTTAMDTGHSGTPYLAGDTQAGNDPLTLNGNATWPNDAVRGAVLGLDGTNADAAAPGQVLTTTKSFSVSTWAKLSSATQDADIVSQDATQTSGFALQYDHADDRWAFTMPTSDTATPTAVKVLSTAVPTVGTWTHFVATYNATNGLMSLYVNGALQGTATNTTPVNATGTLVLGRGLVNRAPAAWFPGDISTMDTWNYTLALTQIAALYEQIN